MTARDDRSFPERECAACPLASRRRFLADAAAALAAVAASLGARSLRALPVRAVSALDGVADRKTYAIPAADGVEIDKDADVILVRWQNAVYAFNRSCPHQNTALRWEDGPHEFQCPKHHSKYKPDGTFITGRATRSM